MSAPNPYGSSHGEAAVLLSLDPRHRLRLTPRPLDAPLFGGHHLPPQTDLPPGAPPEDALRDAFALEGPLLPCGEWQAPPFTPHPRRVSARLHRASAPHPPGEGISPAGALGAFARGQLLLDRPTLIACRALADAAPDAPPNAPIDALAEAIAGALAAEDAALPSQGGPLSQLPHPVAPGIDLLPLKTPTIPPATHTNCYVLGGDSLLVVDPASPHPGERARLLRYLRGRGAPVKAIFLTHHHGDHVGGAMALKAELGCPILAHPITRELLAGRVEVDRVVNEGDVLTLPGSPPLRLRALFTPGHAQGHLCLFDEVGGALIAGDMVAGWGSIVVDYHEGDMALYLRHLARLEALTPRVVLPAHGPPSPGGAGLITAFIRHRQAREDAIVAALVAGAHQPRALMARVYSDVPAYLRPAAEASLIAHLLKLEGEGRLHPQHDGALTLR